MMWSRSSLVLGCAALAWLMGWPLGSMSSSALRAATPPASSRSALQPFNEWIGAWRATGEPEGVSAAERQRGFWKETWQFGWKFKGDEAWITIEIKDGKHFQGGEIHYLPKEQAFELRLQPKEKDAPVQTFIGQFGSNQRRFIAERTDEEAKEVHRFTLQLIGEVRASYALERRPTSRRQFNKWFTVSATKEGESLAGAQKSSQPECVVSGGLGTIQVSHQGKTYYVCCTGCRDAFNEDPEKYIKEFEAKKKKEK